MKSEANTTPKTRGKRVVLVVLFFVTALLAGIFLIGQRRGSMALPNNAVIDRIVVEKSARKLSVLVKGKEVKRYRIALGQQPVGAKEQEGDMKTPEGSYTIDYRNPHSDYHLALHISYPAADNVKRATVRGVSAGGDIMIHGLPNGHRPTDGGDLQTDWTAGCIALTDEDIEELWRITPDGTPVEIRP